MKTDVLNCRLCPRLVDYRSEVKAEFPGYFNNPVSSFGAAEPQLLIVGLAPGLHGANASGRPFTGDASGHLLFQMLYKFGFSSHPSSTSANDGMTLIQCRITNAVKCLPPKNKPLATEVTRCNPFLKTEINSLKNNSIILTLGGVAHKAVLSALGYKQNNFAFGHLNEHQLTPGICLINSYHCSRYNIQTRRLSTDMFDQVFQRIRRKLKHE